MPATKISPYLLYAHKKLIQEGKYEIQMVGNNKVKMFEDVDLWEKMLEFHKLKNKMGLK